MVHAVSQKVGITPVRARRVGLDWPCTVCACSWFCSLFRNHRHDGVPLTAAAGDGAKVECELRAADMARMMEIPNLTVAEPN